MTLWFLALKANIAEATEDGFDPCAHRPSTLSHEVHVSSVTSSPTQGGSLRLPSAP